MGCLGAGGVHDTRAGEFRVHYAGFFDPGFGWSAANGKAGSSRGVLEVRSHEVPFLLEHGHRPEFTCRFRWQSGSIAFWDNRCTKHLAVHDAGPFRRIMRRTQITGDRVF